MNENGNLKDPDRILSCSSLPSGAKRLLHSLIADWGVIADLGYADLQLAIRDGNGGFIYAAQVRPATTPSCCPEDVVGQRAPRFLIPFLSKAMESQSVLCPAEPSNLEVSAISVNFEGAPVGVVLRFSSLASHTGKYEQMGIDSSWRLFGMIPLGQFPYSVPVNTQRHNAHVADGFITLNKTSLVTDASPNAISCFKRLGHSGSLIGKSLSKIAASLSGKNEKDMSDLLSGAKPLDAILSVNKISVTVRSLPLWNERDYCGAVILCREITEIRRKDNELKIKDATIAEINHRIKNNLQSIASLLAMQRRSSKNEEVRKALDTAGRRVQTIAILHDSLSQSKDEMIDFDSVLPKLMQMDVDIMHEAEQDVSISYGGSFGLLFPQDATPLSMIFSELVMNAIEHGFEGKKEGNVEISAQRQGRRVKIAIKDDGQGFSPPPEEEQSLGMQIVRTLIQVDFQGSINWKRRESGGTEVNLDITLKGPQAA